MKRFIPTVRALRERLRDAQVVRLTAGLTLLTPAVLFSATAGLRQPVAVTNVQTAGVAMNPSAVLPAIHEEVATRPRKDSAKETAEFAREFGISESLAKNIHTAAVQSGIKPATAFGLVRAESSFRTRAVSPVGAIGLTQVMPATAREIEPGTTRSDLMRPETNLRIGFKYLRQLIDKYGSENVALTAYNRGPGTVNRLLRQGRNPDNGYAEKVKTGESRRHVDLMNAKFGR